MGRNETVLFAALLASTAVFADLDGLEAGFRSPPASAKPHTWYHIMNGNATKEGITCDFEAIARVGLGGVQMFDAGCDVPAGPVAFNSPEWFDLLEHAVSEARRLGLEICIPNCSGWSSSGGPWNTPSNAMKVVTWREVKAKGPSKFRGKLPRETKDNGFYEDIAVVAFPTPPAESREVRGVKTALDGSSISIFSDESFTAPAVSFRIDCGRIWNGDADVDVETSPDGTSFSHLESFRVPIARHGVPKRDEHYHAFPSPVTARAIRISFPKSPVSLKPVSARLEERAQLSNLPYKTFAVRGECARDEVSAAPNQMVVRGSVRDITGCLEPDGTLDWDVPDGEWTIVRIGFMCNGRCNHPASDCGRGLEVDKLSASAMDFHFSQYIGRLCERLGPLAGDVRSGLNNILVDSYEVGSQNWTQGLDKTFEARMGYSLHPYLPVFAGRIVGGIDESERFLEDFRRVVADLFAENYAGRLAELCHKRGLKLSLEPYGSCPADDLQYGQDADIPMGEFWSSADDGDRCTRTGNARFAAHLAHVWGRRYAATESFTASPPSGGRWRTTPFMIKAQGDCVYCDGINRIIYHRFTHQPWPGSKYVPGMTMGRWGMHLDRTQTWWELSKPWFRYQARCQWMLQEGVFVADALYFCGESAPNRGGVVDGFGTIGPDEMKFPDGYDWDICATKALKALKVVDGQVVAPGGVAYRLLVLPPSDTMSEELLDVIESLIDAGAKVCGMKKPVRAPGLRGYPETDGRIRARAEKVWAKGVFMCSPGEALARLGVEPDFASPAKNPAPRWIHRRGKDADWYFVALNNEEPRTFEASFRIAGKVPEIWDAEKGTIAAAPEWREEKGRTIVTLDFPPSGSAFVVFRKEGIGNPVNPVKPVQKTVTFSGPWEVTFPVDWYSGGTTAKTFNWAKLTDWTEDADPDIKYFSGTATYSKRIAVPEMPPGARLRLDLGAVKDFAELTVNGKSYEVLWRPPFHVDVTDALDGADTLDISVRVTNLWPNRLIGDDRLYEDDCTWEVRARRADAVELGIKELPQWVKDGQPSPTGRQTFTTWKHWTKDDALLPSGLLGPVTLQVCKDEECPVSENVRGHENIEWSVAYAYGLTDETKDLPRVLLVGDSICRGYQEGVRERLKGKMNVSYWISSYCVTSPAYLPLLTVYLDEAKYDVIHFNNGLHSLGTPTDAWAKALKSMLALIREKQPQAKIVWCTSTPLTNDVKTAKCRELNAAAAKVVAEFGVDGTDDLFALCDPLDRAANWIDEFHFRGEAKARQAGQVAASVLAAREANARQGKVRGNEPESRVLRLAAKDARVYDAVVCGAGPAGCAAAIAAKRSGLSVLLVEAQSRLGGTATSGGVSHWLGGRNDLGEWVVGGIFRELSLRAERECAAILPKHPDGKTYQPYAWLPWFIHGVVLDSDRVALMLDSVMEEEGVDVLFETRAVGVEKDGDRITHVVTHSKDGFRRIPAKVVIDATGDADVAAFAGCPVLVGRDGDHLTTPASLTFHLSHVDGKALWDEIERTREPKFRPLIEELKAKGEWPFPYDIFISVKGLADDEVMINTMRLTEIDGTSAESRTQGYVRGRREAYQLLDILRKHFPGFKDAQMKSVAPMLGIRETRRLDGAFKLTVEDLRQGTEFVDTIGYSMYGWDLPDPKKPSVQPLVDEAGGGFVNKAKKQLVTPIPYRVMVPRGCRNLLCPGRAISVERDVLGPLRVMAPCMAMGEACGAAARQIAGGIANDAIDVEVLKSELRTRGCVVDKSALPVVRPRVDPTK